MILPIEIKVPVRIVSEANTSGPLRAMMKRKKNLKAAVVAAWIDANQLVFPTSKMKGGKMRGTCEFAMPPIGPLVVTFTRIAPLSLDDDNLVRAFKAPRDQMADLLGVDDRDKRVTWKTAQRRGAVREYAFFIRIERREDGQ